MTVKEQLSARVAQMTDEEAAETLRLIDQRAGDGGSLRGFIEANRLAPPLSEEEAERLAVEEVRAMRNERRDAA